MDRCQQVCRTLGEAITPRPAAEFRRRQFRGVLKVLDEQANHVRSNLRSTQVKKGKIEILRDRVRGEGAVAMAEKMATGTWTHDYGFSAS